MEKKDFKILVADDDEIARDVVGSLLSREGYPVVSAKDGGEAIHILSSDYIGLVITDLKMPTADGIEVLKYAVKSNPDIAVVILTAYGTLDTTLEAIKEGAYDYLTKPFKGQEMLIVAERAHKRAVLTEENRELKRHLRDACRDMESLMPLQGAMNSGCKTAWIERIERLAALEVFAPEEAERLKERLVMRNGKG